jgi:phosphoenolpyruvate synthase/pyruvate phosphate dikinase
MAKNKKYVYAFEEGNRDMKEILGGKGANLAEMNNLGINVPPGFTITTEACALYYTDGKKINILRNFRYTYYALKFKKHFKRWLWEKVREPKIMAKFHPSHLNHLLDTDDLEVFLDDWINK